MTFIPRPFSLAAAACTLVISLTACSTPGNPPSVLALDSPGELTGKIVGPIEFGQPGEGAGLKAYALELPVPIRFDDRGECGEQIMNIMAIEQFDIAPYLGKTVRLRATPFCQISRSGKYHLKDVTVRETRP